MKFTNRETILTEKGKVATDVRESLMKKLAKDPVALFEKAKPVGKGKYELEVHNSNGTETIYLRFEVSISERSLTTLAEKKSKPKASTTSDIEIE